MFKTTCVRVLIVAGVAAVAAGSSTAGSGAQGRPQLRITAIANQGGLKVGNNQFRVNVQNSSQSIPASGPVAVRLEVLDPYQGKSEYTTTLNYVGPGQDTTHPAWFRQVNFAKPGAYTVIATVDPEGRFGPYPNNANQRTEVFSVPGAQPAAYRLLVSVKNANGSVANGLRVAVKTAEGQELFWKLTAGLGQADFQKLAPSPANKPYTIVVTAANVTKASQALTMPAQDHLLNIQLTQ